MTLGSLSMDWQCDLGWQSWSQLIYCTYYLLHSYNFGLDDKILGRLANNLVRRVREWVWGILSWVLVRGVNSGF